MRDEAQQRAAFDTAMRKWDPAASLDDEDNRAAYLNVVEVLAGPEMRAAVEADLFAASRTRKAAG